MSALLDVGATFLASAVIGAAVPFFNAANAHIGVGDSTVAFAKTQTDLQATTNKTRKPMRAGFPTVVSNVTTWRAAFFENDANYAWNEWIIANAPTGGTALVRVVVPLGTKLVNQIWTLEVTVTWTA